MEKFFKVTNKEFFREISFFRENVKKQRDFVKDFFEENNIDGDGYCIRGDGRFNCSFSEYNKSNISLYILPTENNLSRFENSLNKGSAIEELRPLRKNSKLLKKFQDECVQNNIIINLLRVRVGDYFKELRFGGYSTDGLHECSGAYFLKVHTDNYDTITPTFDGFKEIKGSEYYQVIENLAESRKE